MTCWSRVAATRPCARRSPRARQARRVLLVESAPKAFRGGNSRHTRNLRAMHEAPNEVLTDAYREDEYWDDLLRVTGGQHRRGARPDDDSRVRRCVRLDAAGRRSIPAVADRDTQSRAAPMPSSSAAARHW